MRKWLKSILHSFRKSFELGMSKEEIEELFDIADKMEYPKDVMFSNGILYELFNRY